MANGHGGYRQPANPAPVSGPGPMSQRTDGTVADRYVTDMPYGEGEVFMEQQQAAPMGNSAPSPARQAASSRGRRATATPLFAPTQRPDEPVTAGAPVGPGPSGPPAANPGRLQAIYQRMLIHDPSPDTAYLLSLAQRLGL